MTVDWLYVILTAAGFACGFMAAHFGRCETCLQRERQDRTERARHLYDDREPHWPAGNWKS